MGNKREGGPDPVVRHIKGCLDPFDRVHKTLKQITSGRRIECASPEGHMIETKHENPWKWLGNVMKARMDLCAMASLGIAGAAFSLLAMARGAQYLVDKALRDPTGATLNFALVAMVGSAVLMAVSSYVRASSVNALSEYVGEKLRTQVFAHLLKLDMGFHAKNPSGDMVSRLGIEIGFIQNVINVAAPNGIRNGLLLLGGLALMAHTSLQLSLLTFLAVPLLSVPVIFLAPKLRVLNKALNQVISNKVSFLTERLAAIRTAQLFAAESRILEEMAALHRDLSSTYRRSYRLRGIFIGIVIIIVFSLIAFILWSGGRLVLEGKLSSGEVAAFVMYAIIAAGSLATLMELGQSIGQARASIERLQDIMSTPILLTAPANAKPTPVTVPRIEFENVSFNYPGSSQPILRDISFAIEPRETIALVGPSGAGKTTVFSLLVRLYDPVSGVIRLDGTDIREFDPRALRALFGIIPQEPDIFALSVSANIGFGLADPQQAAIASAAKQANASAFIEALEQGYDTVLGERGIGLSVGQKQRLAIARALVRDPKILLMDEATSALDAESERLVQQALQDAAQDRTALIIAHRLATIRSANRILVLDKGQVVATGKHDELIGQGGLYAHLASLQFLA